MALLPSDKKREEPSAERAREILHAGEDGSGEEGSGSGRSDAEEWVSARQEHADRDIDAMLHERQRDVDAAPVAAPAADDRRQRRSEAGESLRSIRASLNPEGMLRNSRSPSAFEGHQRKNERLMLWLFDNAPGMLVDRFRHDLHDEGRRVLITVVL